MIALIFYLLGIVVAFSAIIYKSYESHDELTVFDMIQICILSLGSWFIAVVALLVHLEEEVGIEKDSVLNKIVIDFSKKSEECQES